MLYNERYTSENREDSKENESGNRSLWISSCHEIDYNLLRDLAFLTGLESGDFFLAAF